MMKSKISALFILLMTAILGSSCGMPLLNKHVEKRGGQRIHSSTDSIFASYVASFEVYGKQITSDQSFVVGDIPINFGVPENNSFQGVCYIYGDDTREIIIRKSWWDGASDEDKESLIFHELGHCRLDRDHDNALTPTQEKASLMHEVIVRGVIFHQHRGAYVNELFTHNTAAVANSFGSKP